MPIDTNQLRCAILTAELHSFSRAAEKLNLKQATLSRRIMLLERRLGITLFVRTTRGAEPTKIGTGFIEAARRVLADLENLETTARATGYGEQGQLVIGHGSSLMAGPLKQLIADYIIRNNQVQFDGVEGGPAKLISGLLSQTLDVTIAPTGLEVAGIAWRPLWSERLVAALYDKHDLVPKDRVYWNDLRPEIFVQASKGVGSTISDIVNARLSDQGFRPNIIQQDVSVESVLSMVPVERFITVAAESSQGVSWPGIQFRPIHELSGTARLEFAMYWRKGNENPALQRFFDLVNERYPCP